MGLFRVESIDPLPVLTHSLSTPRPAPRRQTLESMGLSNTYGLSIIAFTVLIKVVTLPLNYKQIESTTKMQAIQPMVRPSAA